MSKEEAIDLACYLLAKLAEVACQESHAPGDAVDVARRVVEEVTFAGLLPE